MNNYDQSSSGVNLELSCFFDTDLSYINFTENFKCIDPKIAGKDCVYQYIDWGNLSEIDICDIENYHATKNDLLAIFDNYEKYDLNEYCKKYYDKPFSRMTKAELIDLIYTYLDKEDLFKAFKRCLYPKFKIVKIHGYCQGDYAEIIVPDSIWGVHGIEKPDDVSAYYKGYFTKLFFNAPLNCRLTIDDSDLYFDEYVTDQYTYDKDELIAIADSVITHDKKAYILEWLADSLPEYPDYR